MAKAVFLTGYWRSGTNGTVAALNKHHDIAVYNENNPQVFNDWKIKNFNIINDICTQEKHKVALFKPVTEPYRIPEYLNLYTDSKIIYLYREPEKVCRSGLKNFEKWPKIQRQFLKDFFQAKDIFHQYNFELANEVKMIVKDLYKEKLSNASVVILRWIISNQFYLKSQFPSNSRILTVSYELLTENPTFIFQEICNFLNLEFNSEIIEDIKPSTRHQFKISLDEQIQLAAEKCYQELNQVALSLQNVY